MGCMSPRADRPSRPAQPHPAPHAPRKTPNLCQRRVTGGLGPPLGWKTARVGSQTSLPTTSSLKTPTGGQCHGAAWFFSARHMHESNILGGGLVGSPTHITSRRQPCLGFPMYDLVCRYRPQRGALGLN